MVKLLNVIEKISNKYALYNIELHNFSCVPNVIYAEMDGTRRMHKLMRNAYQILVEEP
jgi:hypothetical protein